MDKELILTPDTFRTMHVADRCKVIYKEKDNDKILDLAITGLKTKRSIDRYRFVWKRLSADSKNRLPLSPIANNFQAYETVARETRYKQKPIVDALLDEENKNCSFIDVLEIVKCGRSSSLLERKVSKRRKLLDKLSDNEIDLLLTLNQDKIIASLKRLKWLP